MKPNKMIQAKAAIPIRLIPDRCLFLRAMKSALSSSTLAYRWVIFKLWRLVQTHSSPSLYFILYRNWLSQIHSLFNTWQVGYQITSKRSLPWLCGMGPPGDSLLWGRLTIACWLEPLSISESQCKDTKSVRRQLTVAHTCSQLLILFHRFSLLWCL